MGREGRGWKEKGREGMGREGGDCPLSEILNTPLFGSQVAICVGGGIGDCPRRHAATYTHIHTHFLIYVRGITIRLTQCRLSDIHTLVNTLVK